jgi:hypothetical protein
VLPFARKFPSKNKFWNLQGNVQGNKIYKKWQGILLSGIFLICKFALENVENPFLMNGKFNKISDR